MAKLRARSSERKGRSGMHSCPALISLDQLLAALAGFFFAATFFSGAGGYRRTPSK
jgi:hypothetical protein